MRILISILITFLILTNTAKAETLIFKNVLNKAASHSYDLKISEIDIKISDTEIKEAKSDYFPIISVNYNAQYDKDLTDGQSSLTSVGDSIVVNNTRYLNALSAGLQYNLFDFGVRRKKLNIAQKDKQQKQTSYEKNLRNLKLDVSGAYTKALLLNRELDSNEQLLSLNKTLFSMQENLFSSGVTRKTDLTDQALQVAVLINKIDNLKTEFKKALEDISYLTGEKYSVSAKILNLFDEEENIVPISLISNIKPNTRLEIKEPKDLNAEDISEYKEYQLEIEKKKAELSILKRQNLPQFKFLTNYYFYGTDKDNYFNSFSDMENRSLNFRVVSSLPVFDGLKNKAQRDKTKLEIERLNLERDKRVESVKSYYQKSYQEAVNANSQLENQEKTLELIDEKISMLERLNNEKLIDKISYLKQKIDLITQKLEYEKTRINCEAAAYRLKVLANSGEMPAKPQPLPQPVKPVNEEKIKEKEEVKIEDKKIKEVKEIKEVKKVKEIKKIEEIRIDSPIPAPNPVEEHLQKPPLPGENKGAV